MAITEPNVALCPSARSNRRRLSPNAVSERHSQTIASANQRRSRPPMADSDCARVCRSTTITVMSTAMESITITARTHRRIPGLAPVPVGWGPGPCPVSGGGAFIDILGDVLWNGPADQAGGTNLPAPFAGGMCSGPPSLAAPVGSPHATAGRGGPARGELSPAGRGPAGDTQPGPGEPGSGEPRPGAPGSGEPQAGLTARRARSLLRLSASTALR